MKRCKVIIQLDARADLREIYRRVRDVSRSDKTARLFVNRIFDACALLGTRPFAGRLRNDLEQGLRTFPFEKRAMIAYHVRGDVLYVTNVFYGGRDYEALFAEPPDDVDDRSD